MPVNKFPLCRYGALLPLVFALSCTQRTELDILATKKLFAYPSASAIECKGDTIYLMGDDAPYLLMTDTNFNPIDSLEVLHWPTQRIPKSDKPDLESMTWLDDGRLLLTGSGSKAPERMSGWLIRSDREKDSLRLDRFFERLNQQGIRERNIEGLTTIPGSVVLANRGSLGYRKNHLIFTSSRFWERQQTAPIHTILTGTNPDSNLFRGISGLDYAPASDALILTVSTEDTRNSLDDGAIGKSYIWIIHNISTKKQWKAINPNRIIDLETTDPRFRRQKIESVAVRRETNGQAELLLAADNDDGSSTLFRITLSLRN